MDMERTMQFLLEQQARFDARQAQFDARQAEFDARQAQFGQKFEESVTQINSIMLRLATAQERTNFILTTLAEKHVELAAAQERTNSTLTTLAEKHVELAAAQITTEQKLHAVISALERHIDNHT